VGKIGKREAGERSGQSPGRFTGDDQRPGGSAPVMTTTVGTVVGTVVDTVVDRESCLVVAAGVVLAGARSIPCCPSCDARRMMVL